LNLFEFLMVLVSLIIGLGIAELLSGIAQTIRNRETAKLYWKHVVFVIIVFLALLQQWWEIWGIRDTPSWSFPGLLMMLGGPIGLFLIAHLLFPHPIFRADFKAYYYNKMKPALWVGVLTVIISGTFRPVILGSELFALDNLTSFLLVVIFICMTITKKSWFHGVMVILILLGILADILLVNSKIQ